MSKHHFPHIPNYQDRLIDIVELSHRLCLSRKTIYNQLSEKKFPIKPIRIGGKLRWKESSVNSYLKTLR